MQTWKMRTLDIIIAMLGHENKVIDVLKMDIEGDEWNVLEDILDKKLLKVRDGCDILMFICFLFWDAFSR